MAAVKPEDFVAAWMRSPKANWYRISNALKDRYKSGYNDKELKLEREWIAEVLEILKKEEDKVAGLAKVRIQRTMPHISFLDEKIAAVEAQSAGTDDAPDQEPADLREER